MVVPALGRLFCGDAAAYAYILESLKGYPAQRGVAARMRELGLANVRIENLLGGAMSIILRRKTGLTPAMARASTLKVVAKSGNPSANIAP